MRFEEGIENGDNNVVVLNEQPSSTVEFGPVMSFPDCQKISKG